MLIRNHYVSASCHGVYFGLILLCIKQPAVMIMDDTLREAVRKIATNYLEVLPEENMANVHKTLLV